MRVNYLTEDGTHGTMQGKYAAIARHPDGLVAIGVAEDEKAALAGTFHTYAARVTGYRVIEE